jgi:hypothetical protein
MRLHLLAAIAAAALVGNAAIAADPAAPPETAAKKKSCKGRRGQLGSRIKRAATCDAAGNPQPADERLPISLQIKPPQADPGQRRPPQ